MGSIGSWWVKGFGRRDGEEVVKGFYANHLRKDERPLGGKLYVTTERVLFCPHLLDAAFGGTRTMIPLRDIDTVERFDPTTVDDETEIVGGGSQERLRITTTDGAQTFFVINDLSGAIESTETTRSSLEDDETKIEEESQ